MQRPMKWHLGVLILSDNLGEDLEGDGFRGKAFLLKDQGVSTFAGVVSSRWRGASW